MAASHKSYYPRHRKGEQEGKPRERKGRNALNQLCHQKQQTLNAVLLQLICEGPSSSKTNPPLCTLKGEAQAVPPATLSLALLQITFVLWHFPQHWVRAERLGNSGSCREPRFDSLLRAGLGRESGKKHRKCLGTGLQVPSFPCTGRPLSCTADWSAE